MQPTPLTQAMAAASLLVLALPAAFAQATGPVLPRSPSVAAGQAQISTSGNRMTVVNTPQTILNWNSFSVGSGNAVYFQQQGASSAVLNRVTGNEASSILGSLGSNGQVWLLNPNGVLFGPGARVDVAGLVASTLRLADTDWLAGRYSFSAGNPGATVLNQGELRSSFGGRIALLGDGVANEGLVAAPGGQIALAAGRSIELVDTGAPNVGVRISADAGAARNLGTLLAPGGRIDIHAATVNQSGIVSANGFAAGPGGEVWIMATGAIDLGATSRTSADGASGGLLHIESASARTTLAGSLSAQGSAGTGGQVALLGNEVGVLDGATVDASGAQGGGSVRVGGGLRGQDPAYANAQAVYFGAQASLRADATQQGDGGQIVLWSNLATRAYGSLSVRGGALGGDGGLIETSGGWLDARPLRVDTSAPRGRGGSWLLDPFDLTISDNTTTQGVAPDYSATSSGASIASSTIVAALNNGTDVTVSTGGTSGGTSGGTESGTLSVTNARLVASAAAPGNLTLIADGNLTVSSSSLGTSGGPMSVQLLAGRGGGGGAITITDSTIDTSGGESAALFPAGPRNITLGGFAAGVGPTGNTFTGAASGVIVQDSNFNASGGTLSIAAAGGGVLLSSTFITADTVAVRGSNLGGDGVRLDGVTTIFASENLTLSGRSASGYGVLITDGVQVDLFASANAGTHLLLLEGAGGGAADVAVLPVAPDGASVVTEGGANLSIAGANLVRINGGFFGSIDASDGGDVQISAGVIDIASSISGSTVGGGLRFSGTQVSFSNAASITSDGPIKVDAASINIDAGSSLASQATGDAIVLAGPGGTAITGFVNGAGAAALSVATGGRYIVYADSPASLGSADGGLLVDFKRVGAGFGGWSGDLGNGLVFAAGRTATANVVIADRNYDGTLNAPILSAVATASGGDTASLLPNVTASYADPNAGIGKPASLNSANPFSFEDSNGVPIYGYTVNAAPTGNVRPAPLSGTPTVLSRVYDATTAASLTVNGLTGLIGSEQVTVSGSGVFNDKNVGSGKPVTSATYVVSSGPGGLAGNYSYSPGSQPLTGTIAPRSVSASGVAVNDKVYDGTTSATFASTGSVTALPGDSLSLQGTPAAAFADKNVGNGKPVTLSGFTLGGADAANYTLLPPGGLSASITPLGVTVAGVIANNKVYDGSTSATLSGTAIAATLAGDQVALQGQGTARFADKNAGTAKAVTVSGYTLAGSDAANYTLTQPLGLSADISPATLQYVAVPAVRSVGAAALNLTGSVTGFIGTDTLAADTQGAAVFSSLAPAAAPPGVYGVLGSGLSALNYRFVQAPGNAQALTLVDLTPQATAIVGDADTRDGGAAAAASVAVVAAARPTVAGIHDETVVAPLPAAPPLADFGAVRLASLSAGDVASLLAGRQAFMDQLLAQSVQRLANEPGAADLRECETLDDMRLGICLVTTKFKTAVGASGVNVAAAGAPAAAAATVPAAAPEAAAPAAPSPATATATAAAAAITASRPAMTSADALAMLRLAASRRAVRSAALPQIERKIALLIGVDRYQDNSIPTLSNAVNDARAVAQVLEQRLGYETVVLENATKPALVTALNELALSLGPRDSVIVYYAGHGELVATTKLGYWLLADSVAQQPETWLSNTDIAKLIAQMGASQVALISDSCYSGSLASEERIRALAAAPDPKAVLERRSVVVMSSGGNEPVADEGRDGHSPFAWNLMNTLNQLNNWQAGGNVFERVRFAVARTLPQRPQYTASRVAGHQPGGDYLFEQRALAPAR